MPTITYPHAVAAAPVSAATIARVNLQSILADRLRVDGVFEGGGALGPAYVGAMLALHDNGVWFKRVAGNSAGAIMASMVAVGFTAPEIFWLCSAFPGMPNAPASLAALGITSAIQFSTFLDLPTVSTISQDAKRQTMLWRHLDGAVLDWLGEKPVPVPTQSTMVNAVEFELLSVPVIGDAIRTGSPSVVAALRTALNVALTPLPNRTLHIADFMFDTSAIRAQVADALWDVIAARFPAALIATQLLHEGSVFEGRTFLRTLQRLFARKVHNWNGTGAPPPVLFKHVNKIPLAIIASDIARAKMRVYSSRTDPDVEIAEAVRQSMSIPFVFEARGDDRQFVDGGLCSNFPIWLYSAGGNRYWPAGSIDPNRVKMGFTVDEHTAAPAAWNARPAPFPPSSDPIGDLMDVVQPILVEKLVDAGVDRAIAERDILWALVGGGLASAGPGCELIRGAFRVGFNGLKNTEDATRREVVAGLMHNSPYIDVSIPLKGFSAADFFVNEDGGRVVAMYERGWRQAFEQMSAAVAQGTLVTPGFTLHATQPPF